MPDETPFAVKTTHPIPYVERGMGRVPTVEALNLLLGSAGPAAPAPVPDAPPVVPAPPAE